ncbi:MAG: lantibiotic dehydratase [Cytophagales bacterium]|nr:lantibiotic dehydratase [Cytophagales bacterium]
MALEQYEFHEKIVVRTPTNTLQQKASDWEEIIQNKAFLEALSISSKDLHQQLMNVLDGTCTLTDIEFEKLRRSVQKYWSRMCTRTTPFGLFASVGVADWSAAGETKIHLSEQRIARKTRLDMSYLYQLAMDMEEDAEIVNHLKFFPNSSIYIMGEDYRFLESESHKDRNGYKISAVSRTSHLNLVLKHAEEGILLMDLFDLLCSELEIRSEDATMYLSELVEAQILVSELEPTVTGPEYYQQLLHILERLRVVPAAAQYYEALRAVEGLFDEMDRNIWNSEELYQRVLQKLSGLGVKPNANRLIQVDSFAAFSEAKVNNHIQQHLRAGIACMMRMHSTKENQDIKRFVERFQERYEGQLIPLSEVLDPETGIGYPEHHSSDLLDLGDGLDLPTENSGGSRAWNEFETWAFERLVALQNNGRYEFELSEEDLEQFQERNQAMMPSLAVMFRVLDRDKGEVFIESVGGSSAVNLLGRFAHGSQEIHDIMKDVVHQEEQQNPDVVFAEIAHLPESRMGNILQRPAVRPYEIPYLAKSGVDEDFQVHIQDLYVKVERNKVQLWSRKLNKRVIPRLSSAHNFRLSDLPVYKFLCDLQTHEKSAALSFRWGALEQQFTFFPRVRFQNAILSPAQWRFSAEDICELKAAKNSIDRRFHLALLRDKWHLPRNVVFAEGDNELLLDLSNLNDVQTLLEMSRKKDHFILKESMGFENKPVVSSSSGGHANQMLACLVSEKGCYNSSANSTTLPSVARQEIRRKFLPGSEWLYYKVYAGDQTSDLILRQAIRPMVAQLQSQGLIDQWFFIRYDDGNPHLRFRVHLKDRAFFGDAITLIADYFDLLEEQKMIWKTEIASYEREINRYGVDTIEMAEEYFYQDSEALLKLLTFEEEAPMDQTRWLFGMQVMDDTLKAFHLAIPDRLKLLESYRDSFMEEFKVDKKLRLELDLKYRKYQQEIHQMLVADEKDKTTGFEKITTQRFEAIQKIVNEMQIRHSGRIEDWQPGLVGSLIHMSVNRLVTSRQRFYEMILYYFMVKHYKSRVARMNKMKKVA